MLDGICIAPTCTAHVHALSLCKSHYSRFRRYGVLEPLRVPNGEPLRHYQEHIMAVTDDCKIWPYMVDKDGYGKLKVGLRNEGVHKLACEAWHGPKPSPIHQAAHGPCHNRACWNGAHLSWRTPEEQQQDTIRDGTKLLGNAKPNAKFTDEQVREIRKLYASGLQRKALSEKFQVHRNTINLLLCGKSYRHVQ